VLPAKWLRKSQRVAIFLIFLFAAVATPTTDPFTMCAMAVPMVLLFEGAVLFSVVHDKRKAARKAAEKAAAEAENLETPSRIDPIPRPLDEPWGETT
jgi:sec-independent protein translocase protein TatC